MSTITVNARLAEITTNGFGYLKDINIMKDPKIETKVVHSQTKPAWNVVGETWGKKYKIARIPYVVSTNSEIDRVERQEAFEHAKFISYCFNNFDAVMKIQRENFE